jgi:hypothetical protein
VPTFQGNQVFPLDNPWNQVVASAPVASDSAAIINAIVARHNGSAPHAHPDWGNPLTDQALYGIPINVVDHTVPKVDVTIAPDGWASESDLVQVPIPGNAQIEGDDWNGPSDPSDPSVRGDSHLLVYNKDTNELWELGSAARPDEASYPYGDAKPLGVWGAWQVSYWNLNTNYFRTIGATSADAAGLPIMPGLVRHDEANPAPDGVGVIDHAIRVTFQRTRNDFVFPASHDASNLSDGNLPRMGERFRLKASYVIPSSWSPEAQAIAQAMKTYGLIVADNGSDFYFQGEPSDNWNMDNVLQLEAIPVTSLEVVDLTPRVTGLDVTNGPTGGGTAVTITGKNFGGAAGQLHVFFGNAEATSVTVVSDTQLVAVDPAHAAGVVNVQVQSGSMRTDTDGNSVFFGYGTSPTTTADRFLYGTPPKVTSVVVNDGSAQRSEVRSITITFDTQVTFDAGAITLIRSGGVIAGLTRTISTVNNETQVVLTFQGSGTNFGSLMDGNWTLRIYHTRVHRADYRATHMAADSLTHLFRLYGDANGDGQVDSTDQSMFNSAFGQVDATSLATFDYNRDGAIDSKDQVQFQRRLGHHV